MSFAGKRKFSGNIRKENRLRVQQRFHHYFFHPPTSPFSRGEAVRWILGAEEGKPQTGSVPLLAEMNTGRADFCLQRISPAYFAQQNSGKADKGTA